MKQSDLMFLKIAAPIGFVLILIVFTAPTVVRNPDYNQSGNADQPLIVKDLKGNMSIDEWNQLVPSDCEVDKVPGYIRCLSLSTDLTVAGQRVTEALALFDGQGLVKYMLCFYNNHAVVEALDEKFGDGGLRNSEGTLGSWSRGKESLMALPYCLPEFGFHMGQHSLQYSGDRLGIWKDMGDRMNMESERAARAKRNSDI